MARITDAMMAAGFEPVQTVSRNGWFRAQARVELDRLHGPVGAAEADVVGADFVAAKVAVRGG